MGCWEDQGAVVQAIGQAVIVTDLEGVVRAWNTAAERLYGWTGAEAIGRQIVELTPTEMTTSQATELMTSLSEGGSWSGEFLVRDRRGREFPVLVTDTPLHDEAGELIGIVGVSVDVSELHDARRRAQHRASQQAAVAGLAGQALVSLQLDELFERATRVVAEELDAPLCKVLERLPVDGRFRLRAGVGWQAGLVGTAIVPGDARSQAGYTLLADQAVVVADVATETRFQGPDLLTDHHVVAGVSTVIPGRGTTFGVLGVHTTAPRTFTADDVAFLDAVAGVLGGAIAREQVEAELRATVEELARSDAIRVAFLRATSHELRTPLSAMAGFAETLQHHDHRLTPTERAGLLGRLVANTDRLTRLIEDLLDVDRLSAGLIMANREPHDLRDLVHRVLDEVDVIGRRFDLDLDPVTAEVDVPKIERVVVNLASNAVRHTAVGARIRIALRREGRDVLLSVEDDGPGIDPSYLSRIFEPFAQGPERHEAAKPGTGLGLTLARQLVTLHGGTLTAANRAGGGARFDVVLPDPVAEPHTEPDDPRGNRAFEVVGDAHDLGQPDRSA